MPAANNQHFRVPGTSCKQARMRVSIGPAPPAGASSRGNSRAAARKDVHQGNPMGDSWGYRVEVTGGHRASGETNSRSTGGRHQQPTDNEPVSSPVRSAVPNAMPFFAQTPARNSAAHVWRLAVRIHPPTRPAGAGRHPSRDPVRQALSKQHPTVTPIRTRETVGARRREPRWMT